MANFKVDNLEFSLKDVIKLVTLVAVALIQLGYYDKRLSQLEMMYAYDKADTKKEIAFLQRQIDTHSQDIKAILSPQPFDKPKEISVPKPVEQDIDKK